MNWSKSTLRHGIEMNLIFIPKIVIGIKKSQFNSNSIPIQHKISMGQPMANGTEFIETNSTENEYLNQQFDSGFTTILPEQIREAKFAIHGDISGLILCTIFTGDNVTIIDREIIETTKSYKLYKINHLYVMQPAGMMSHH